MSYVLPSSLAGSVCSWECEECYSTNSTGKDRCELCRSNRSCPTNSVSSASTTCSTVDVDVDSACYSSSSPPRLAFDPVLPAPSPTIGRSLHDALQGAAASSPLYLAPRSPKSATRAAARAPAGVVGHVCENCEAKFFPDPLKAGQDRRKSAPRPAETSQDRSSFSTDPPKTARPPNETVWRLHNK